MDQIDTLSFLSSGEKDLINTALGYAITGFSSQGEKEDLIDDWNTLSGKFLDGSFSGGIIAILLYSDCFWSNYQASTTTVVGGSQIAKPRWLNLALTDVAGGGISFIKSALEGAQSGENADPQAGIRYLKKAGMDALRTSAGPFGLLF